MTCTESIVNNIEVLARASGILKISFILIPIALLFHVIGFSTRNWLEGEGRQGLWKYCGQTNIYECCSTIEFFVDTTNSEIPGFINVTRVFQCFGLFGALAAIVLIILCIFLPSNNENKIVRRVTMVVSFVTAGFIILGSIIYGGRYKYESLTSNYTISYSYALCTVAGIIFIIPGILLAIDQVKRRNCVSDHHPEPSAPPLPAQPLPAPSLPAPTLPDSAAPPASNTTNQGSGECSVCYDAPIETVFIPCGHNTCCVRCSENIRSNNNLCPICRRSIDSITRIYRT